MSNDMWEEKEYARRKHLIDKRRLIFEAYEDIATQIKGSKRTIKEFDTTLRKEYNQMRSYLTSLSLALSNITNSLDLIGKKLLEERKDD